MDEQGGAGLTRWMILLVADARRQWAELDRRIAAFDAEFAHWVKENEEARPAPDRQTALRKPGSKNGAT
jgi:hypothetical protein